MIKSRIINAKLRRASCRFNPRTSGFNTQDIDHKIAALSDELFVACKKKFNPISAKKNGPISAIATTLYDSGGHTTCLLNFSKSFGTENPISCFLTRPLHESQKNAPQKLKQLSQYATIYGSRFPKREFSKAIISLFNQIAEQEPSVIFVYTHPKDFVAAATLHLLKRLTGLKIVFMNHADHFPCTGMMFADQIIDARPAGFNLTRNERGYENNIIIDLQSPPESENVDYPPDVIKNERARIGAAADSLISASGCAAYKIFDDSGRSTYLELIRDVLVAEPKLIHVLVTELSEKQGEILNQLFEAYPDAKARLKVMPFRPDFDMLIQTADLFVDSFPQGSALTHIDCMRARCPTVLKINQQDPFKSFESYLPVHYAFAYTNPDEMKNGILRLLQSETLRKKTGKELHQTFFERFEFGKVKHKYQKLIEGLLHENY